MDAEILNMLAGSPYLLGALGVMWKIGNFLAPLLERYVENNMKMHDEMVLLLKTVDVRLAAIEGHLSLEKHADNGKIAD